MTEVCHGPWSPDRPQPGGAVVDGGDRFRRSVGGDECSEDQSEREASPCGREHPQLSSWVLSRSVDVLASRPRPPFESAGLQKCCSKGVRWAREELNLRPLPCQIQRATADLNVGPLETGKDHRKAAGERKCHRPAAPTIRHPSIRVVLISTAIGCCA